MTSDSEQQTTMTTGNENVSIESLKKLIAQRDELDHLITEKQAILRANGADMTTSLVDDEGYPITSVDVYSVRHARNAIICAQNDRDMLTKEIEMAMLDLHEREHAKHQSNAGFVVNATDEEKSVHRTSNKPFAVVDKVLKLSPAFAAGLRDGDQIIQMGSLHFGNVTDMKQLSTVVQNSINRKIRLTVLRSGRPYRLELTPRSWSGQGVLGCSVLPVKSTTVI